MIKVWAGLVPSEHFIIGLQMAVPTVSSCGLPCTRVSLMALCVLTSSSYKGTSQIGLGPPNSLKGTCPPL